MKRIITLLLTLAMTFSLAMPAQAASTKASTMRLMDTVGTATVENAAGKNLSIKDNMRLYNGYEVATKDASYAYISLDSSKAVKLDASSAVKVNQSGKKLELDVTAGELMFNVPVALKSDESLNIRTSTMVTGIRGTAGWVNALDRYTTRVAVLEGAVTINSQDPFTGADRAVTITGGQIATIIRHERAMAIQQQLIDDGVIIEDNIIAELTKPGQVVEELQESGVPGFVATEVAANEDLQDRMNEESPLSVEEITKDAQKKQKDEEKAAAQQKVIIEEKITTLNSSQPGLPFTEPEVIIQTNTVTERVEVPVPGDAIPVGLNNPTTAEVQTALDEEPHIVAITNVTPSRFDITALNMDSSDILYVVDGDMEIPEGATWTINGYVSVLGYATLTNYGTIHVNDLFDMMTDSVFNNYGTLNINNSMYLDGMMTNTGGTVSVNDELLILKNGIIRNSNGTARTSAPAFVVSASGILKNSGAFYNESSVANYGEINNEGGFYNNSVLENNGTFINGYRPNTDAASLMYAEEDESLTSVMSVVLNKRTIQNNGTMENYGSFYNNASGGYGRTVDVYGIVNTNSLQNYGYFFNNSLILAASASSPISAFEMYDGTLEVIDGRIVASGDNTALYYAGGALLGEYAYIVYEGTGNGYALCTPYGIPSTLKDCSDLYVTAPSLSNLLGVANDSNSMEYDTPKAVRADTGYEEDYVSYYDASIGRYYKYEQIEVDVITIYNVIDDTLYEWRCIPYEAVLDYNNELIGYALVFENIHEHEGGPC